MNSRFSHAIILDFEATCDDQSPPSPREIIEFPSVLLSLETHDIVDEFEAFVKPVHFPVLSDFCKSLTAIRQSDVDNAEVFSDVLRSHGTWLGRHGLNVDNAIMVTCGDWDLGTMLPTQFPVARPPVETLDPIYSQWQNVKHAYCSVTGKAKAPGMAGMLRELGLELSGHHHRGIDDCRNIAALLKDLLARGATPQVTAHLPMSKYPPITIQLRLGDRVEQSYLDTRSVKVLYGVCGRLFRCKPDEILRINGQAIENDGDLASLISGETLQLIVS